ncbi:guanine nucleotide-binding protein-like 3 [Protopterus annectens]|uniref:guanine nucleotide-binding protein-like 3 n=1 Tax=Protopterus annectens TaxID=7888 RepID=UPI001CFBFD62|nr:guanine nucleotide-binding protein-like 3 [Protopterus annectens]
MKRPKLRKASKRITCRKKYKIQKKIREHKRKLRKEAKKHGHTRPKKAMQVPNEAPFKEEVLREAELRKQRLEEQKEKQKLARQKELEKKRKLKTAVKDPTVTKKESSTKQVKKVHNPYSRSSKKSFCIELKKVLAESDVLLEVLDARDPLGSRCPQVEKAVLESYRKKKIVLVLNKIDLVPKYNVQQWLQYLKKEFPVVAFKSSTQLQDKNMREKKMRLSGVDVSKGNTCVGRDSLLKLLQELFRIQGYEKSMKVGVLGFTNVGKSSIVNSMKQIRACNVGLMRGITKLVQEVHIDKQIKMLDSPGIIALPSNPKSVFALRNTTDVEKLDNVIEAASAILNCCNKQHIMLRYNVPNFRNSLEFFTMLAEKRGALKKGGIPDAEQAAKLLLYDWTGGKVSYYSAVPEAYKLPSHLSLEMVEENQKSFSLGNLEQDNFTTLRTVQCPNIASSVAFQSAGLTVGAVDENDVEVEEPEGEVLESDQDDDDDDNVEDDGTEEEEHADVGTDQDMESSGSEHQDDEMEEPEILPHAPNRKKIAGDKMSSRPSRAAASSTTKLSSDKRASAETKARSILVNFSTSAQDDDAYDFNTDFI